MGLLELHVLVFGCGGVLHATREEMQDVKKSLPSRVGMPASGESVDIQLLTQGLAEHCFTKRASHNITLRT